MQTLLDRRTAELHTGSANQADTCRCGQPLELCTSAHCPRCGMTLTGH